MQLLFFFFFFSCRFPVIILGPLFTAVDLALIAHEFDRIEADVMAENGLDTSDYLKFMGEDSGNVALDGNYSVQVLQKALEVFHIRLVRTTLPEGRAALQESTRQLGFIGNLNGIPLEILNLQFFI